MPKYPGVTVELSDSDGNAFIILGAVTRALRRAGVSADEIAQFRREATAGDYDNVIQTAMAWVNVE